MTELTTMHETNYAYRLFHSENPGSDMRSWPDQKPTYEKLVSILKSNITHELLGDPDQVSDHDKECMNCACSDLDKVMTALDSYAGQVPALDLNPIYMDGSPLMADAIKLGAAFPAAVSVEAENEALAESLRAIVGDEFDTWAEDYRQRISFESQE